MTGFKRGSKVKQLQEFTDKGPIDCEQLVVAVGPWVRDIWNMLELPQTVNIKNGTGKLTKYQCGNIGFSKKE
ncbi:MAG: hypothetical protein CM1200mP5_6860 [Candidatus Pelagibacterales bacterium]|nr:MAG: hypothetical protein CM1200mP5_6860 [Pelagibacterales bacterium]